MNRYKYLLIISALLLITSCGKWLDVTPKSQVGLDKMFSSEQGFEDVLYGCYTSLTDNDIYGAELSYGFIDAIAQYYETAAQTHIYNEASKFVYTGETAKSKISNIWLKSYYTIANCNVLLDNLVKANKNIFSNGHDIFIEAEAKAIRAFVHFNLLRIFAPAYKKGENPLTIPYADEFRYTPFAQRNMNDFLKMLLKDLQDAYKLLKDVDPVFNDKFKNLMYHFTQPMGGHSEFLDFRAYRMNYYAVAAMLARVYNYMGDKENALIYAEKVIDNDDRFKFVSEGSLSGTVKERNANFVEELIFCLQYNNVHKKYELDNASSSMAYFIYGMTDVYTYSDDFRRVYSIAEDAKTSKYFSIKHIEKDGENSYGAKVSMIRLSELYLIAAECSFEKNQAKALKYINYLRLNRGILTEIDVTDFKLFMNEVTKEAQREFLAEGQMFYWCKRLGLPLIKGNVNVEYTAEQLVLPLPDVEVEFGDYKLNF